MKRKRQLYKAGESIRRYLSRLSANADKSVNRVIPRDMGRRDSYSNKYEEFGKKTNVQGPLQGIGI